MSSQVPVADWMTDFDHFDTRWIDDPFPLWDEMRARGPIAVTDRYKGYYFPTTWEAARQICFDPDNFSSSSYSLTGEDFLPANFAPPLTADPPDHRSTRRLLMQAFSASKVKKLESSVVAVCEQRLNIIERQDCIDAVAEYARHIPAQIIAVLLGITASEALEVRTLQTAAIFSYARSLVEAARDSSGDNVVTTLLETREDGRLLSDDLIIRLVFLIIVTGMDNTQMMISASLWHLATHPHDLDRLVSNPNLLGTAADEFLRLYSPATLARVVRKSKAVEGCLVEAGRRVVMPVAAANRDPEKFANASHCIIDRSNNGHAAFGFGIHRCVAEKLARMQLTTALGQWLRRIPVFTLDNRQPVTWTTGFNRGPHQLPLLIGVGAVDNSTSSSRPLSCPDGSMS